MTDRVPEHAQLNERMDEVLSALKIVRDEATAAHEEARGAHTQAKLTNGKVAELRTDVDNLAEDIHGTERDPLNQGLSGIVQRISRVVLGDPDDPKTDGGLAGYIRTQQRDIRLIGAWVVVGLPLLITIIIATRFG